MAKSNADTLLNRFVVKVKFRHMQVLIKLAELGTMRRTAEAVGMTQPAVSQMISELERLLETQLFFRHARGVEPTETTKDLLPVARRILEALQDGSEAIANRLNQNEGVVRVLASPAAIGGMLHSALDSFATAYPNTQVHLTETSGNAPLGGPGDSHADIICTREPTVKPEGWSFNHYVNDQLIAVCSSAHPIARLQTVSPDDLGQAKWLLNRVGSVARERFEELFETYDWPVSARCEVILHIPLLTQELLLTGKYLAILPRSVAMPWLAEGTIKELDCIVTHPLAPLGILWRKEEAGPASQRFVKHLLNHDALSTPR